MKAFVVSLLILASCSAFAAQPLPAQNKAYDPKTTALLMNLCRESLCKIVNYHDRFVLDEEYSRLANNIDVTLIRDDEIAELIKRLMIELNALKLDEMSKSQIIGEYERKLNLSILKCLKPAKELMGKASTPVEMACEAILVMAWATNHRGKSIAKYNKELAEKVMTLQAEELKRLTELRTEFFSTEYVLYRRYNLPDRLNLKEMQLDQYIRVLQDDDPARRLERLDRLKEDFSAYPPFWYQIGLTAQELGRKDLALEYYKYFDQIATPVLREDPDRVAVCMHRIMLLDPAADREAIVRDLQTIERNTKYYYRWENILFAALTYYRLNDLDNARRLIQTSINEGYNVPLHEQVSIAMESMAAENEADQIRQNMLDQSEKYLLEGQAELGRTNSLLLMRAWGTKLTDIRLTIEPRSKAAQNAKYAVPGYNVYLLGRSAMKGDVYYDNIIARFPLTWDTKEAPSASMRFNGNSIKAGDKERDKDTGEWTITFPRAFDQDDILQRGRVYPCSLMLRTKDGVIEIGYEAKRVTEDILRYRPDLPQNEPYFEIRTIAFQGEDYRIDKGLIVPAE